MIRNRTSEYEKIVRVVKDRENLEGMKLRSRLLRIAERQQINTSHTLSSFDGFPHPEQVIPWIEDHEATQCHVCAKNFHRIVRWKHHCRACGKVICQTCSCFRDVIPQTIATSHPMASWNMHIDSNEKKEPMEAKKVRVCMICVPKIDAVDNRRKRSTQVDALLSVYERMMHIKKQIDDMWPYFLNVLNELAMYGNLNPKTWIMK
jgi:hypothetical protein